MRVPEKFYRARNWQRFFAGVFFGAVLSWGIFLYLFGALQEEQAKTIKKQQEFIAELEKEKKIWQEDFEKRNEENEGKLTVNKIEVKIANAEKYRVDPLTVFEIEKKVKEDIRALLAKDLEEVFNTREIIRRAVENKEVEINDKRYVLKIREMFIYTTFILRIDLLLA